MKQYKSDYSKQTNIRKNQRKSRIDTYRLRYTLLHTHESHKNTKPEATIYTERICKIKNK